MQAISERVMRRFHDQGFVVVEGFCPADLVQSARARFAPLFRGEFETGLQPDEWNWHPDRDPEDHARQICNAWKSDRAIARLILRPEVGEACARLMDWPGARINQDNVIWKPQNARALGFHQDDSYQDWVVPSSMVTCWMALDDTAADGGTIAYAPGSHRWRLSPMIAQFHAPEDFTRDLRAAAAAAGARDFDLVAVEAKAGDAVFHHGRTWHGSAPNRSGAERRSVVAHCMSSEARFHPTNVGPIYGRYRRFDSDQMDESFFPILWTRTGGRSSFLEAYLDTK
jgi:ectoine hydroxylase-related dioxygenase (phytanoyl-CoA dioxygenase family)